MDKILTAVTGYGGSLLGAFLFVLAINTIIIPHGLYSGTMTGVAQIIEVAVLTFTPLEAPENINLAGIALFFLNIPLLIMVLRVTSKSFPVKSIINIVFMTVSMALLPIPDEPVIYDTLTACIAGGALAGFGAGLTLRSGGSSGGTDLIGVYCSIKYPDFTVGRVSLIISVIVYSYAMIARDFNTVIYSAVFTVVYAFILDYVFHQNIKVSAFIFTTNTDAVNDIVHRIGRGATYWEGKGAYTGKHTYVIVTVISKYEVTQLKRLVTAADENAFITFTNKVSVEGNFLKKF